MKRAVLAGMCGMVFLLSSCGGNSDKTAADEEPKALEVKLTGPEKAAPHEKTEYKAEVFTAASVSRMQMKSCLKYGKKEKRQQQNKQGQGGKRGVSPAD